MNLVRHTLSVKAMVFVIATAIALAGLSFFGTEKALADNAFESPGNESILLEPLADSSYDTAVESTKTTPTERSIADIRKFYKENPFSVSARASYASEPSITEPYAAGSISVDTAQQGINALNLFRYIAGIDANVTIDKDYAEKAQAAALVNAATNELTHSPKKPQGMSNDLYQLGLTGASSSNIAWGYPNPASTVVGYIADTNTESLGHRLWCLNPSMGKTGFGYAGTFSAMYAFDSSNANGQNYTQIAWPAKSTPIELFSGSHAWNISKVNVTNTSSVKVVLKRTGDGKTWNFSSASADGYFRAGSTIVFKPDNIGTIKAGDEYQVSVEGITEPFSYTVKFFALDAMSAYSDRQFLEKHWVNTEGWLSYVTDNGIMSGYSDTGAFAPDDTMNRAMAATILYRAATGETAASTNNNVDSGFKDVAKGQWFTAAIQWCKEQSIVNGYTDSAGNPSGNFGPNDPVTREQLAKMIALFADHKGVNIVGASSENFDKLIGKNDHSAFAKEYLIWCTAEGVIGGVNNHDGTYSLNARGEASRAAMAKMITVTLRDII